MYAPIKFRLVCLCAFVVHSVVFCLSRLRFAGEAKNIEFFGQEWRIAILWAA
jgi:hypothetical protein